MDAKQAWALALAVGGGGIGGGGSGRNADYTALTNKPSINGVTLSGNKTGAELGLNDYTGLNNLPTLNGVTITGDKTSADFNVVSTSSVGTANGIAELDSTGRVPSSQLPSYVDDVVEGYYNATNDMFYADSMQTQAIDGETGKIYLNLTTNIIYRWGGSRYVKIFDPIALGETSATAYRGDRGKAAYDKSNQNETNIGTLASLTTSAKTSIVAAVNELVSTKQSNETVVTVSDTAATIDAEASVRYVCGTLTSLVLTIPSAGYVAVQFSSGSTPTNFTLVSGTLPDDFAVTANADYELNFLDGKGVYSEW